MTRMLKEKRYGAIDIGSNGVRALIADILEKDGQSTTNRVSLIRVPIRLGADVFTGGVVSNMLASLLVKTIQSFGLLFEVYNVSRYKIHATSALRQAKNRDEILNQILSTTGLKVQVLEGAAEACTLAYADVPVLSDQNCLFVDVGGGSTEYTVFSKGQPVSCASFDIGTLRPNIYRSRDIWDKAKKHVEHIRTNLAPSVVIGSGGNINTTAKHLHVGGKKNAIITYDTLKSFFSEIETLTPETLSVTYGFKPDRVDVIKPALSIYLATMSWMGAHEILVPKIGLVDGIIKKLYLQDKENGTF